MNLWFRQLGQFQFQDQNLFLPSFLRNVKLSPWFERLILVVGLLPGVLYLFADVSEHLVCFIFWVDEDTGIVLGWVFYREKCGRRIAVRKKWRNWMWRAVTS